jgi:hypothetical protein
LPIIARLRAFQWHLGFDNSWFTATNRPQGFGSAESEYFGAGHRDAPIPVGMTVWA